jgi:hypothetical protein
MYVNTLTGLVGQGKKTLQNKNLLILTIYSMYLLTVHTCESKRKLVSYKSERKFRFMLIGAGLQCVINTS